MCDYSLHAMASRPAKVGETLVTTTFPRTSPVALLQKADPGWRSACFPEPN
jgi:hypothetical protein